MLPRSLRKSSILLLITSFMIRGQTSHWSRPRSRSSTSRSSTTWNWASFWRSWVAFLSASLLTPLKGSCSLICGTSYRVKRTMESPFWTSKRCSWLCKGSTWCPIKTRLEILTKTARVTPWAFLTNKEASGLLRARPIKFSLNSNLCTSTGCST